MAELDKTLFEGYLKTKSDKLGALVRGGIADSQIDWYETPQPTGMGFPLMYLDLLMWYADAIDIRPYMYETLMTLVGVHAQVCNVAESLLDRTLNALVEELASEALRCFRQVKRFGIGGMLRVRIPFDHAGNQLTSCGCRPRSRLSSCIRRWAAT